MDTLGKFDPGSSAKDKLERDTRWVGDFTDDLTVAIALRKWDHAVALVEEGLPTCSFSLADANCPLYRREQVGEHAKLGS